MNVREKHMAVADSQYQVNIKYVSLVQIISCVVSFQSENHHECIKTCEMRNILTKQEQVFYFHDLLTK